MEMTAPLTAPLSTHPGGSDSLTSNNGISCSLKGQETKAKVGREGWAHPQTEYIYLPQEYFLSDSFRMP